MGGWRRFSFTSSLRPFLVIPPTNRANSSLLSLGSSSRRSLRVVPLYQPDADCFRPEEAPVNCIPSFPDVHNPQSGRASTGGPESYVSEELCLWVISICKSRSLNEGLCVHSPIIKQGFEGNAFLVNNLLSWYSKRGRLDEARKLFDGMSHRDVVSWTAIISAYSRDTNNEEALALFENMLVAGPLPNEFTFSSVLCACTSLGDFGMGIRTHAHIIKCGIPSSLVLGSSLTDFYSKLGRLEEAWEVFTGMDCGDTVSWTTMISAFVQAEDWSQSLYIYQQMISSGTNPNEFTFVKLLNACVFLGLRCGEMVHAHIILWGVGLNLVLKTALVDMYLKCHSMENAVRVFNQTPEFDVMLCTVMISGYAQAFDFQQAVTMLQSMGNVGISPLAFTYAGILNACSSIDTMELGEQIHCRLIKAGLEQDVSVGNALIDMYLECSSNLEQLMLIFRSVASPNVVTWTTMIKALVQHKQNQDAFSAFTEMQISGVIPNSFTVTSILKGCLFVEDLSLASKIHSYTLKTKIDILDLSVGNSLIDVYGRLGKADDALKVFNEMLYRDLITYTSLVKVMNQVGFHQEALDMIVHMRIDGLKMDHFSLSCFLSASAGLGAMMPGKQLHCYSIKSGLDSQTSVLNGLVDMYGKCGSVDEGLAVFRKISEPNIVSWNGMISALASNGHIYDALSAFEDMRLAGTQPDEITLLLVLYACSHGGLVDLGLDYFNSMSRFYGISPKLDHYICLVDLLGRSGRLDAAAHAIDIMPFQPDALIYKTLLSSCKLHKNLALGECMARCALELDPSDTAIYVLLSNIYEDFGKLDHSKQTRQMMRGRGLKKCPGQSWMEIRNKIYHFNAGDTFTPHIDDIHEELELLKIRMRNSRECHYLENASSSYHSEKLAVAFGLLNTAAMVPLRIFKNLRICDDCHMFMELTSRLVDRQIIIRDASRFHSFKEGNCSCGGYW